MCARMYVRVRTLIKETDDEIERLIYHSIARKACTKSQVS